MTENANQADKIEQEGIDKLAEENKKMGPSKKLMAYNNPKYLIPIGILFSFFAGCNMPVMGLILSKFLTYCTAPWSLLEAMDPVLTAEEFLEQQINFYALIMFGIAIFAWFCFILQKGSFSLLGEEVTYTIRKELYESILQKNIGWFDQKENATSVITSAMAEDTTIINGTSTEAIAP